MRMMQLIGLRRLLPLPARRALRGPWMQVLAWEQHLREKRFYRQFVTCGDLVFDVGANLGVKTRAFLSLGAKVVAVEPNPLCVSRIRADLPRALATGQLKLEPAAVARESGTVTLTVFDSESAITSGSAEFLHYASASGFHPSDAITVRAMTLDELTCCYGLPKFLKLDVEGMDGDVLRGLSQRPRYLSFEYQTHDFLWKNTRECFDQAARLGYSEANLTDQAKPEFLSPFWMSLDAALADLAKLREGEHWGDVVVR